MRLRKEWNLGFDPIYNIVEMLELKSIKVLLLDDDKKFNGLSGYTNSNISEPFIVLNINKELSDDRKRFTALHELGHLLLPQHKLDEEKASDRFAGAFLFPKESVFKEFGERRTKISFEELKHIKLKYGISIAGIVFRLHQLHIINDAMFKRFWIKNRTAKFDDKVILKREERVTRFENLLAHAYSEKLISLSKLAELSGESVDDALAKYGEMI
jgi:Zn-dependent peptidase ImmA (M78 family)